MEGYTKEQRVFIVEQYLKNNEVWQLQFAIFLQNKVWLIGKYVAFGTQKIHELLLRNICIHNVSLQKTAKDYHVAMFLNNHLSIFCTQNSHKLLCEFWDTFISYYSLLFI